MKKQMSRVGREQPLAQKDYEKLAEFRYLLRRFQAFSERAAADAKLTPQQHQALLAIKGFPGGDINTGQLAERLGVKHHSSVELIDRLVRNGLLRRRSGEADRRQVLVYLTPKAEKLLAKLTLAHRTELERLAPFLKEFLSQFDPAKK